MKIYDITNPKEKVDYIDDLEKNIPTGKYSIIIIIITL